MENKKTRQIGDKVWILDNGKIRLLEIKEIRYVFESEITAYGTSSTEVFSSKEELIESLNK